MTARESSSVRKGLAAASAGSMPHPAARYERFKLLAAASGELPECRSAGPSADQPTSKLADLFAAPAGLSGAERRTNSAIHRWDGTAVRLRSAVGAGYRFTSRVVLRGCRLDAELDAGHTDLGILRRP